MTRSILIVCIISILSAFSGSCKAGSLSLLRFSEDSLSQLLSISEENIRDKTGVYTLENGGKSLFTRLWFFAHAQKSIDIQYYSFAKDVTGLIASDYLVRAAERGVKIRILIDDAADRMYSHEVQLLDSHENIEIRIYNAGLRLGRLDRRLKKLAKNAKRIQRRMHNKTLTIDGLACIMGGRNIADEYFDYGHKYNFRDRDVLLIGKSVKAIRGSFDEFWNSELTVLYSELSGKSGKKWYNDPSRFERLHQKALGSKEFPAEMKAKAEHFPAELKQAQQTGELAWTSHISFVSDKPGKNGKKEDRAKNLCTDSLINLISEAKTSIIIQSPYFINTPEFSKVIAQAVQRGVKIRLLTNSLASTDNYPAFSGYQKDREKIMEMGVEIYEFKPDAEVRYKLMIPEIQAKLKYKPVYGLHSKTIIIDGNITVIGSYNFDPRSVNYNTECLSIIRSKAASRNLMKYLEEEFLPVNAWRTRPEDNPDSEAGIIKRLKAASRRWIPKKYV